MLLSENLDYEYNPIDIIKGNKIKKELKSNPEMDNYKRVKLYKKLIDIHNGLFDEVTGILKNKYLDFYKKTGKNTSYTLDDQIDIEKIIYLNLNKNKLNLDEEIIKELNKFQNMILENMYQNFINSLN